MDADIREDVLKPASTRSKIVVNLREPKNAEGKKRAFQADDAIEYELDPYDKVRMRLLKPGEELYKAYQNTIQKLQSTPKLQPKKRKVPCCRWLFFFLLQYILLAVICYFCLLII